MSYDKITTIINTFNSEDIINQCLNSLDSKVRAIIIENSNNESFKKEIEKKYLNVNCYLTGLNLGYAKGNNLGLSKVQTDYALILNPDTTIEKDTIQNLITVINSGIDFSILAPLIKNLDADTNYKNYGFFYHEKKPFALMASKKIGCDYVSIVNLEKSREVFSTECLPETSKINYDGVGGACGHPGRAVVLAVARVVAQ